MKIICVSLIGLFLLTFVACEKDEKDVPKFASGEATALVYKSELEYLLSQIEIFGNVDSKVKQINETTNNILIPVRKERMDRHSPFGYVDELYLGNGKWAVTVFSNGFTRITSTSDTNWGEIYNNYEGFVGIFIVYEETHAVLYKGHCGKDYDHDADYGLHPCNDLQKTFR